MIDNKLIRKFTRAQQRKKKIVIQVLWVTWPHPHKPESHWQTTAIFEVGTDKSILMEEREKLILSNKYFAVCEECHKRKFVGHMLDKNICQSCGEKNHRIIF